MRPFLQYVQIMTIMVTNLLLYLLQTGIHKDLLGHHNSLLEMAKVCIYCIVGTTHHQTFLMKMFMILSGRMNRLQRTLTQAKIIPESSTECVVALLKKESQ